MHEISKSKLACLFIDMISLSTGATFGKFLLVSCWFSLGGSPSLLFKPILPARASSNMAVLLGPGSAKPPYVVKVRNAWS